MPKTQSGDPQRAEAAYAEGPLSYSHSVLCNSNCSKQIKKKNFKQTHFISSEHKLDFSFQW